VIASSVLSLRIATAVDRRAATAPMCEPVAREWPARELPPGWRWEKPGVQYEHRYRATSPDRATGGLKWIRNSGP
jgi:hypothetical protein